MIKSEVLDIQNPAAVQGAVVVVIAGISGKIKLYAYATCTCAVQPGYPLASGPTPPTAELQIGGLAAQTAESETPHTITLSWEESILGGARFFTYCVTSATVVGPVMPDAEVLAMQLLSPAGGAPQVAPLTAAYLVASFADSFRKW